MPTMPLNPLAFPSEWLALRMAKSNGPAVNRIPKKRHPHSYPLLGGDSIVLSAFSRGNRAVFRRFLEPSLRWFPKLGGAHLSRDAIVFCLATLKRSRQSTEQ